MRGHIAVIGMVCVLSLASCGQPISPVNVMKEGDMLIIRSGKHTIYAHEIGAKRTEEFLLTDGTDRGLHPFTAHFSVMTSSTLQWLERKHGSFGAIQRKGLLEETDHLSSMFLYPIHPSIARDIHQADDLAITQSYPLIRMTFVELDVAKHTARVLGREVAEDPKAYRPCYLVLDIEILETHYAQY